VLSQPKPISVSSLNLAAKDLLESNFPHIWVEGEISNFSQSGSVHIYFTLKDANAQVPCAFFRQYHTQNTKKLANGQKVLVRAKLSLYAPRGSYQLIVSQIEAFGTGLLELEFQALKLKLEKMGLFNSNIKKAIPTFPSSIGIITSKTGAALQDVLSVIAKRYPVTDLYIYDAVVQGEKSAPSLRSALKRAISHGQAQTLIICRGGGSMEDLWSFNDEQLAHDIYQCPIPIISGVGHEIDFTICDMVADLRAPTPSAGAQQATPDRQELWQSLDNKLRHLTLSLQSMIHQKQSQLERLRSQMLHPRDKIKSIEKQLQATHHQLHYIFKQQIQNKQQALDQQKTAVITLFQHCLHIKSSQLCTLSEKLGALSPLSVLDRGYTLIKDNQDKTITQAKSLGPGSKVIIQWADGAHSATIDE
jgi:exodeoxyribonuclease VII large subunit